MNTYPGTVCTYPTEHNLGKHLLKGSQLNHKKRAEAEGAPIFFYYSSFHIPCPTPHSRSFCGEAGTCLLYKRVHTCSYDFFQCGFGTSTLLLAGKHTSTGCRTSPSVCPAPSTNWNQHPRTSRNHARTHGVLHFCSGDFLLT